MSNLALSADARGGRRASRVVVPSPNQAFEGGTDAAAASLSDNNSNNNHLRRFSTNSQQEQQQQQHHEQIMQNLNPDFAHTLARIAEQHREGALGGSMLDGSNINDDEDDTPPDPHIVGERENYNLARNALFVLPPTNPLRRAMFSIVDSKYFERCVLAVILLNSCTMVLDAPEFSPEALSEFLVVTETIFLVIFTIEMLCKVVALGFIGHQYSYLRSTWNCVDFFVVVVGYVSYVPGVGNFSVVRLFRILRPLRAVSRVPGLTVLITAILNSLPGLLDVMLLLTFLLTMFSVLGIQLWSGVHHRRCYNEKNMSNIVLLAGEDSAEPCGGTRSCPAGSTCSVHTDLFKEPYLNFDNFFTSCLLMFKVVSGDNWPDELSKMQSAVSPFTWFFFFLATVLGSYYTINLILAVLSGDYQSAMEDLRKKEKQLQTTVKKTPQQQQQQLQNAQDNAALLPYHQHTMLPLPPPPALPHSSALMDGSLQARRRRYLLPIVTSTIFKNGIIGVTIVNLLVLSMDHYRIDTEVSYVLDVINFVCSVIFFIEAAMKIAGLGRRTYFKDKFNAFDFVLVLISVVEFGVDGGKIGGGSFTALRALRLARVVRMMQVNPDLRRLVATIVHSIGKSMYLLLLIFLVVFVFSILGLQLFVDVQPPDRNDFHTLWQSMLTVFIVLTGDNWTDIMQNMMRGSHEMAFIYFFALFILGNMALLNLFVAILIDSFQASYSNNDDDEPTEDGDDDDDEKGGEDDADDDDEDDDDTAAGRTGGIVAATTSSEPRNIPLRANARQSGKNKNGEEECAMLHFAPEPRANVGSIDTFLGSIGKGSPQHQQQHHEATFAMRMRRKESMRSRPCTAADECSPSSGVDNNNNEKDDSEVLADLYGLEGYSLRIFSRTHPLRLGVARVTNSLWFEPLVFFLILANAVTLGMSDPSVEEGSSMRRTLDVLDIVFTVLFTLEMAMKIIVFGLWSNTTSYLRDPWNRIDCFVVIVSLLSFWFSSLTIFRSFRTVRLLARLESARKVVVAFFGAIPAISNVVLVVFFLFLIFAILGVQFYKGRFGACSDPTLLTRELCVVPARWEVQRFNFDDVIQALITLFVVALNETWSDVLYNAMDASDEDFALTKNARPWNGVFILLFVFVGQFFCTNLFVGMLIEKFHEESNRVEGVVDEAGCPLLTPAQQQWLQVLRVVRRARIEPCPRRPRNPILRWCYRITVNREDPTKANKHFELFITICIILNVVFMAMEHRGQNHDFDVMLTVTNALFIAIFTVEAAIKIGGMTPRVYFRDWWNRFDFILVLAGYIGFFSGLGASTNAIRVLRLLRILRLIRKARGLNMLFNTLVYAAPALGNIALVLFVAFFVFGVLGVDMFGRIAYDADLGMTKNMNFNNLPYAMTTLFALSTTESWTNVYVACSATPENSDCVSGSSCGNPWAVIYFLLFLIVTNLVGLNLLVYVVVDTYFQVKHDMDPEFASGFIVFDDLKSLWGHFDYRGEGRLRWEQFAFLVRRLPTPVGLEGAEDHSDPALLRCLRRLEVPLRPSGCVLYQDCVAGIARFQFGIDVEQMQSIDHLLGSRDGAYFREYDPNAFMVGHAYAVRKIVAQFRAVLKKRRESTAARKALAQLAGKDDGEEENCELPHHVGGSGGGGGEGHPVPTPSPVQEEEDDHHYQQQQQQEGGQHNRQFIDSQDDPP